MEKANKILIVDDEEDTLEFLSYNLTKQGFEVKTALNGRDAFQLLSHFIPDLIVLDYMMPEMDGRSFLQKVKSFQAFKQIKIAVLTAKTDDLTHTDLLDLGSDDFITKPIKPNVLISRINMLLRRELAKNEIEDQKIIQLDQLTIDPITFTINFNKIDVDLPRKEFQLLYLLAGKPGRVFNRAEILNKVWGEDILVGERTIDVHIRKIREKLKGINIKTIKGIGYKLEF